MTGLEYENAGIENVMAVLAKQYINDHCVMKNGRKVYEGDLHVLQWYQSYDHRKREAQAKQKPEGGLTAIVKGV